MLPIKTNLFRTARALCLAVLVGAAPAAFADSGQPLEIRHLARELNILRIHQPQRYLLLPVQA